MEVKKKSGGSVPGITRISSGTLHRDKGVD